jgi:hypothetical protein
LKAVSSEEGRAPSSRIPNCKGFWKWTERLLHSGFSFPGGGTNAFILQSLRSFCPHPLIVCYCCSFAGCTGVAWPSGTCFSCRPIQGFTGTENFPASSNRDGGNNDGGHMHCECPTCLCCPTNAVNSKYWLDRGVRVIEKESTPRGI